MILQLFVNIIDSIKRFSLGFFRRDNRWVLMMLFLWEANTFSAPARQPFVTDNADVTDKGKFHFEAFNEFDRLQAASFPVKHQNTAFAKLSYGLVENVEVSVSGTVLTLARDRSVSPRFVSGIGDTTFEVKYNFLKERENSSLPAFAVSGFLQLPTRDASRGLGNGAADFGINGIAQRTFKEKNVVRVNADYLFAGNTVSGARGISIVDGEIFTGGASFVRKINDKLQLGGELTGAASNVRLSKGQLQKQFGGNYQLNKQMTIDFGISARHFAASPRHGAQIGVSIDF